MIGKSSKGLILVALPYPTIVESLNSTCHFAFSNAWHGNVAVSIILDRLSGPGVCKVLRCSETEEFLQDLPFQTVPVHASGESF